MGGGEPDQGPTWPGEGRLPGLPKGEGGVTHPGAGPEAGRGWGQRVSSSPIYPYPPSLTEHSGTWVLTGQSGGFSSNFLLKKCFDIHLLLPPSSHLQLPALLPKLLKFQVSNSPGLATQSCYLALFIVSSSSSNQAS